MKFFASALALAALASQSAATVIPGFPFLPGCVSQLQANAIVGLYNNVLNHQSTTLGSAVQTALAITVSNYQEISDSANEQVGKPLGTVTVSGSQTFAQLSQQNPAPNFSTLGIYPVGCNGILWRWVQKNNNNGPLEVKGMHYFQLSPLLNQLQTTYFEFNGLAAAIDTNLFGCHQ